MLQRKIVGEISSHKKPFSEMVDDHRSVTEVAMADLFWLSDSAVTIRNEQSRHA
jgi:hypothetical protein